MRDARRLTESERAEILAAREAGEKGIAIAALYRVSPSYASNLAKRSGKAKRREAKRILARPVRRTEIKIETATRYILITTAGHLGGGQRKVPLSLPRVPGFWEGWA